MKAAKTITIREPDDPHCHLRTGDMLRSVIGHTAGQFARAVVMPNTIPPILTAQNAVKYRQEITTALPAGSGFEPLMTIQINDNTTLSMVEEAAGMEVIAGKVYP